MHTSVQHDKFFINFNQQTFNLMKMVKTPWYGFACERVSDVWTAGMSTDVDSRNFFSIRGLTIFDVARCGIFPQSGSSSLGFEVVITDP